MKEAKEAKEVKEAQEAEKNLRVFTKLVKRSLKLHIEDFSLGVVCNYFFKKF